MELTVTQAQAIHDELAKSTDPISVAACAALLEVIGSVKETSESYELTVTINPDEKEDDEENPDEGFSAAEDSLKRDSQ